MVHNIEVGQVKWVLNMRVLLCVLLVAFVGLAGCSGGDSAGQQAPADDADPDRDKVDFKDDQDDDVNVQTEDKAPGEEGEPVDPELFLTVLAPHGEPLNGSEVIIVGTEFVAETDDNGTVHFPQLAPERYRIRVEPWQDYYKILEVNLTVQADAITRAEVSLSVADGLLSPPHDHDLWQGRTRFEVFSVTHDVHCAGLQSYCIDTDSLSRERSFRFPEEAIVPPGTAAIHVTVDWDETQSDFQLEIRSPGELQPEMVFAASGDTVSRDVVEEEWDPPHAGRSLWTYSFDGDINNPGAWPGPYTITVEVERMEGDLPVDPPHPDLWGGETSVRLTDFEESAGPETTYVYDTGLTNIRERTFDQQIVIPGTKELQFRAWVNWTVAPQDMELIYDPFGRATSQAVTIDTSSSAFASPNGILYEWILSVPDAWWDPIYRESSQWEFQVIPAREETTGFSNGGYDLHMVVDAVKA